MLLNEVIPMGSLTKQTISAQIPIELTLLLRIWQLS